MPKPEKKDSHCWLQTKNLMLKHTKIVATISDMRCEVEFVDALYKAGMNVVKLIYKRIGVYEMAGSFIAMLVGAVLVGMGIYNIKGNISSLHSYHRSRVKEEDRLPFGRLVGIGNITMGWK